MSTQSPITCKDSHLTDQEVETTISRMLQYIQEHYWEFEDLLSSNKLELFLSEPKNKILLAEFIQNLFHRTNKTADAFVCCLKEGAFLLDHI